MSETRRDLSVTPSGALADLLAAEARYDDRLAAARAEAARLIENARLRAADSLAAARADLAAAAARHRAGHLTLVAERRAALEAETAAARRRYERLTDGEITELAEWVVREIVEAPP